MGGWVGTYQAAFGLDLEANFRICFLHVLPLKIRHFVGESAVGIDGTGERNAFFNDVVFEADAVRLSEKKERRCVSRWFWRKEDEEKR